MRTGSDAWHDLDEELRQSALLIALKQIRRRHKWLQRVRDIIHQAIACAIVIFICMATWNWLPSTDSQFWTARQDALPTHVTRIDDNMRRPPLRGTQ